MKAMVLAAGLGTRLRPLTDDRPKALVELGGRTLIEITLGRLREFGVRQVVVNAHHFAEKLIDYLAEKDSFGMEIQVSREDVLLDTGGGLKKAARLLLAGDAADSEESIVVHNVDVISTIDLARMERAHRNSGALATLAVQDRTTSRYLLFGEHGELCGRRIGREGIEEIARPSKKIESLAFAGIHIVSPELLGKLNGEGAFSIIDSYLQLAAQGKRICAFQADEYYWRDLGKVEELRQAEREMKR